MSNDSQFSSWLIEFNIQNSERPLQIRVEEKLTVGRKYDDVSPDVDLSTYDAENFGVSRTHFSITPNGNKLLVEDLDSGNGTLLNGMKLEPGKTYEIRHDDHLQLGRLKVDVRIVVSPSYGGSLHKQQSLQLHDETQAGEGQLILIVEDDTGVAKLLSVVMERAGFTSVISRDVISGIRLFNQRSPSAVILDLMLPGMDGLEFVRYVRRDVRRNQTPIVVVSAASSQQNIDAALDAQADIFLAKPLNTNELTHVISSLVSYHENGQSVLKTKHLVGTAPLRKIAPETQHIAAVLFVAGFNDAPIVVHLNQPVSFGRISNESKNHIDLSKYGAIDQGVSRVHAFLHHKDGRFFLEDNSSVNGSFVDGEPARASELTMVQNGDEIRLGKLRMYIYFLTDDEKGPKLPG